MSGSDDGRIFVWSKKTGKLLNTVRGDKVMEKIAQERGKIALTWTKLGITQRLMMNVN